MRTIKITPEWVLDNLSHTLDSDGDCISLYTVNASDANWIELALNSLEISFEAYDYLNEHNDLVFGFDFHIKDIEHECPNLSKRVREFERSKDKCKNVSMESDYGNQTWGNAKGMSESDIIIQEYKEQHGIECITDEEYTNLFGESALYPNYYWVGSEDYFDYFSISDYDYFLLKTGYDPFTGEFFGDFRADYHIIDGVDTIDPQDVSTELGWCSLNQSFEEAMSEAISLDKMCPIIDDYNFYIDTGLYKPFEDQDFDNSGDSLIIDGVDTINSSDVFNEIFWTDRNLTFEQALEQASFLDRFCPFLNEHNNSFYFFFYDLGDNINEYYRIVSPSNDYEFMKVEEPDCIDEGELEFMLAQDLEYYSSLKSKAFDVYVSDISEVIELLNRTLDETVFRLLVHWNDGENQFLIMVTDNEQFYSYKVGLEKESNNIDTAIYLGYSYYPMYVLDIIQYFQNTGKSLGYCDGTTEVEFLKGIDITNNQQLSEGWIDHILDLATQRYCAGEINLDIEQALIIMLSITHFFKFEMDQQKTWYDKHNDRMVKKLEDYKKAEGATDWRGEIDWIHKNGELQYHICIQDLLLQTLYKLNGSYYRIHDRDYDWEEKFDKIFVDMPFGRKFDRAMIRFLLLPLYNVTHNTNYILQSNVSKNNNDNLKEL